ncbi:MAG: Ni/Fe hydrogenase subunit alpha [Polyangia bacterium]
MRAGLKPGTPRTIRVDYLARVEGEGALRIVVKEGRVQDVELRIFEPPRFFEALLRGRALAEAPDITARICGICPVAYQMTAVHALERGLGIEISSVVRALRRLLYCGEWLESHGLHIYMLHAPDFLGFPDAIQLARVHPELVRRGLELKKIGNRILRTLGGREVHPINVRVGGFYKLPAACELRALVEPLRWARDAAIETARFCAALPFPDYEQDYEFVALQHDAEYPLNEGRITSSSGLRLDAAAFESHFIEEHVARSNALHCALRGADGTLRPYCVGPLARYALCFTQLSPLAQEVARSLGYDRVVRNPFQSIAVRALEMVYACDEALRIAGEVEPTGPAHAAVTPRTATCVACTEAPRGLLYHRYEVGEDGLITEAKIVPPTAQNQKTIEADLRGVVEQALHLPQPELTQRCEQAVRNYDPCISCATHFLTLEVCDGV